MSVDLKNKVALVVDNGIFVDFAVRLGEFFGKVYYFCEWRDSFPKMNKAYIGYGLENIELIDNLFDYIADVDIVVFPDLYYSSLQNFLVERGVRVWGMRNAEELENDRVLCKKLMKKLDLPVGKYEVVKGTAALRKYLKEHDNVFVKISQWRGTFETFYSETYKKIEPKLDEVEYGLGAFKYLVEFVVEDALDDKVEIGCDMYVVDGQYPSKIITGAEIKDLGYLCKFQDYKNVPIECTSFNNAIAPTLKKYGSRGFFSTEIRVGKDHRPYMIDFCFDDKTEVLTDIGWKFFKDLDKTEKVATLNNGFIEYQSPTDYIGYEYNGEMINISNDKKSIECTVTPNHLILRYDRNKKRLFKERADSLTDKGFIPRTGLWVGDSSIEYFTLPEYHNEWDFMSNTNKRYNKRTREVVECNGEQYKVCTKVKHEDAVNIPIKDWAAFLGWYLSEGSLTYPYSVNISQVKFVDEIKSVLDKLPFKYSYGNGSFRISSKQLALYLHQYGLCCDKYVPDYIKDATPDIIRIFLDNFNLGDGSRNKGDLSYFTTSKTLADDIQECIFKCGNVGTICLDKKKGTVAKFKDSQYVRNYDIYIIYEGTKHKDFWFETQCRKDQYINSIPYNGMVYCVTVPNGTIYVRKNGKSFWSSNCSRLGSPPNELYQSMFDNLGEIIWYGSEGKLVDPVSKYKYGAEILIHSSWADKNWQPIDFPKSIRPFVKLRNAAKINGEYYVIPQSIGLPEVGAVIGMGNTKEEAIEQAKEHAKQISGYYIDIPEQALDKADEELQKTLDLGIKLF